MKDFTVTWTETVQRCVVISATCAECALDEWRKGSYPAESIEEVDCWGTAEVEVEEC